MNSRPTPIGPRPARRALALAILIAAGLLAAGCGGSHHKARPTPAGYVVGARRASECDARIRTAKTIPGNTKTELRKLCVQLGSPDPATAAKAASQICQQLITQLVPPPKRAQARRSCPKA